MFHSRIHAAGLMAIAAATAGCNPTYFRTPNLLHPGPAGPQQTDAIYHDPYPLDDVAPAIVGGRPREYQRPVPEPLRPKLVRPGDASVAPAPSTLVPQF